MMKTAANVTINNYYIYAQNIYVNDGIYVSAIHNEAYAPVMLPLFQHHYYYDNDDLLDSMPSNKATYTAKHKHNKETYTRGQYHCSICGRTGHNKATCTAKHNKETYTRGQYHCSNCGKLGHNIRTCKKR